MVKRSLRPYGSDLINSCSTLPLGSKVFATFCFGRCSKVISQCCRPQQPMWESWKTCILLSSSVIHAAFHIPLLFQKHNSARTQFPTALPNARGLMPIHQFLVNNFLLTACQTCFPLKTSSRPDVQISHGEVSISSEGRDKDERFPILQVSGPFLHEKMGLQGIQQETLHPKHAITFLPFHSGQVTPYLYLKKVITFSCPNFTAVLHYSTDAAIPEKLFSETPRD